MSSLDRLASSSLTVAWIVGLELDVLPVGLTGVMVRVLRRWPLFPPSPLPLVLLRELDDQLDSSFDLTTRTHLPTGGETCCFHYSRLLLPFSVNTFVLFMPYPLRRKRSACY